MLLSKRREVISIAVERTFFCEQENVPLWKKGPVQTEFNPNRGGLFCHFIDLSVAVEHILTSCGLPSGN